jgi:hypothetical protein
MFFATELSSCYEQRPELPPCKILAEYHEARPKLEREHQSGDDIRPELALIFSKALFLPTHAQKKCVKLRE